MSDLLRHLVLQCDDARGIVAATTGHLAEAGANITASHQYSSDPEGGRLCMRVAFAAPHAFDEAGFRAAFAEQVARPFGMQWRLTAPAVPKRVALMVSRQPHCVLDLLWRWRSGELDVDVRLVISNHEDLRGLVEDLGVRYVCVPVSRADKPAAEADQLRLLAEADAELVVLARYMQVLSPAFLEEVGAPVINIHHSFLPAFAGVDPYRRAFERGVKLIGATGHYVTAELDAGPIIAQDVVPVTHADGVEELTGFGRDVERQVLARAVRLHVEDRVLVEGDRTVVFG